MICPEFETDLVDFSVSNFNTSGFVAVDNVHKLIVVSFRGTATLGNILADLALNQTSINLCTGCAAHQGFYESWTAVSTAVTAQIKTAHAANPTFRIVATGHSLGGAIATIAALALRNANLVVDLVSAAISSSSLNGTTDKASLRIGILWGATYREPQFRRVHGRPKSGQGTKFPCHASQRSSAQYTNTCHECEWIL